MKPHPLQLEIARLLRRAKLLAWTQAVARWTAATVAALLIWLLSDYFVRYQDRGLRLLGLIAVVAISSAAAWRFLKPLFLWQPSTIDLARLIEHRFPALAKRLASALAFLETSATNTSGCSPILREAVIDEAATAVAAADLSQIFDRRPTLRAGLLAAALLGVSVLLLVIAPAPARLALSRFVDPLADHPWPPRHALYFDPIVARLAIGDAFEARVVERDGNLPREVWLELATGDDPPDSDADISRELMQTSADAATARRDNVTASLWYRATGGDDRNMRWRRLDVVEAPALRDLRITIHPPSYTHWPPAASARAIRALKHSTAEIAADSTKPLASAAVVLESGKRIPLTLDATGQRVTLSAAEDKSITASRWIIDDSRAYWFELVARDGSRSASLAPSTGAARWEIQPITDLPPVVALESPAAVVYLTPQAAIDVRVTAKDDLAVQRIVLRRTPRAAARSGAKSSDKQSPEMQSPDAPNSESAAQAGADEQIYLAPLNATAKNARPPAAVPPTNNPTNNPLDAWPLDDRVGPIVARWDLAATHAAIGDQIELEAIAFDAQGAQSSSTPRTIYVITREELVDRVADSQAHLAEQLGRALAIAEQMRRAIASLEVQPRNDSAQSAAALTDAEADQWRSVETQWRQATRLLFDASEGVHPRALSLLDELSTNHIDLPTVVGQLQNIAAALDRRQHAEYAKLDADLAALWTAAQASAAQPTTQATIQTAMRAAGASNQRVIDTLAALQQSLTHWDSARRVAREIAEIRQTQHALSGRIAELSKLAIGRSVEDLPADERAELLQIVEGQRDLARRIDRTHTRMERLVESLAVAEPAAADTIAEGLDYLRDHALSATLNTAATRIAANQLAQAAALQTQARGELDALLALLENRAETDRQRQLARLAAAAAAAQRLRADAAASATSGGPQIARDARKLARETSRLDAPSATAALATAAVAAADWPAAARDPVHLQARRQVVYDDLAAAARAIAVRKTQLEGEILNAAIADLAHEVARLAAQQQTLLDQTAPLDKLARASDDDWRLAAEPVITAQRGLAAATKTAASSAAAEAFKLALDGAAADMTGAATALVSREQLASAKRLQHQAHDRLTNILTATKSISPTTNPPPEAPPPEIDASASPRPAHVMEELRLLKLMQQSINQRTAALDADTKSAPPTSEQQQQYAALAAEQTALRTLLENLFAQPANQPSPNPAEPLKSPAKSPPTPNPNDDGPSPIEP